MILDDETSELQKIYAEISDALYRNKPNPLKNDIKVEVNGALKNNDVSLKYNKESSTYFGQKLIWRNIIAISLFHMLSLYGLLTFPIFTEIKLTLWGSFCAIITSFGVGAGAHRLWTHRSYKANVPLRLILLCLYCSAGMNPLYDWVRDHRVHHKFSETDADPHNSNRGFFFSHVGWLMMKKHPEVLKKGRAIDMSDILEDPVAAFGDKYFIVLKILFCFIIPVGVPMYFWNADFYQAFISQAVLRYAYVLHATWSVNSVAHMFGSRPFDKTIGPVENKYVSFFTGGEGWHNYHHTVPWDYKASEIGFYSTDFSTLFIDFFAKVGWAYDLKEPSQELVKSLAMKKGDGSRAMTSVIGETKVTK